MTSICAQVLPLTMSEAPNNHAFFDAAVYRLMDRLYGAAMRYLDGDGLALRRESELYPMHPMPYRNPLVLGPDMKSSLLSAY